MAKVAAYKKEVVQEFAKLLTQYPIIGIVNMEGMPAAQLQGMRKTLRGKVIIKMTKMTLLRRAIEEAKAKVPGIDQLEAHLVGMPAVLFSRENPFTLYKTLQKSKSPAPAKPGQKAPREIMVPAGPTPFAPGPVISELGKVGIKAGIEGGKVVVKVDSIVAKEGQVISPELASVMLKLSIMPMEVGLDLVAVFENGFVFQKKVLAIDEKEYLNNLKQGHRWAFNLAVFAGIMNKTTVEHMIQKAYRNSKAVALEAGIMADAVVPELLLKSERQMLGLKDKMKI